MKKSVPVIAAASGLMAVFLPSMALGCPFCSTDTAAQARAEIFGPGFSAMAVAVLSPFLPLGIVMLVLARSRCRFFDCSRPGSKSEAEQ